MDNIREEVKKLFNNAQKIAFEDEDFIKSPACRGLRLEMEYMKPDLAMSLFRVYSTMVIFGSARTKSPEEAQKILEAAQEQLAKDPRSPQAIAEVKKAKRLVDESHYYQVARELAGLVTTESQLQDGTDRTFVVLTGGGGGIMEAGNRGAMEAGGLSAALNITLPFEQHPNDYITPELSFQLHYFSVRKMHFLKRAKALAAFPGGFGTMDELFEVLTLIQTHKIEPMPVLLYGREFWERLIDWEFFAERGLICKDDLNIFTYCETAQEGWDTIKKFYGKE